MRSIATRDLLTPGDQAGPLPLSTAQEGLWFMQRREPLSTAYHLARTHNSTLTDSTANALRALCKVQRCTPFAALMAAWQLLLSRHAGIDDFCIGVPTSRRTREESEDLIGLFVDTQVYRARVQPSMTGRALLQAVRNDTRAALDHGSVTLAALVDAIGVKREADRHPLFQALFNVQGAAASGSLQLAGLDVDDVDAESHVAQFDLSMDIRVTAHAVTCTARYSGSAYVPLDPAYPVERLAHMVADSGITLLITQSHLNERLSAEVGLKRLDLDTLDVSAEPASDPAVRLAGGNLAYVIYTSGSTGKPKGVAVAHDALSMHCQAIAKRYGITPEDRQLHFASISFDAAAEQRLAPLISGAAIVLRDDAVWPAERLAAEIETHKISIVDLPPAYINAFAQETEAGAVSVGTCIVGGEGWSRSGFETVRKHLKPERIFNAYGPSETVITSTVWSADGASEFNSAYAPIGTPVGERTAYVLDPSLCLVPQGMAGELYVGGAGLARGYLNRAALTAERFIPEPFGLNEGGRLYRTGDRVRWNSRGQLEFLARIDHEVNLRGFRIELGEIETALLALPGVRDAVATLHDATRLIAYVSAQADTVIDGSALKAALHDVLPDYMVPGTIIVLDALQLTPNGKVDRHALPAPELSVASNYEPPQSDVEPIIAQVWSEVLGMESIEHISRHDNFFELGGDSIFSLQVQRRIARQLSVEIELAALFNAPMLKAFAAVVSSARKGVEEQDRLTDDMQSILSELMQ